MNRQLLMAKNRTLYFAYGANTNPDGMDFRCPNAIALGACWARGWRLTFRSVADIVEDETFRVPGVLWSLTPACVRALDQFEGYPTLYRKTHLAVSRGDGSFLGRAMAYVMTDMVKDEALPMGGYEDTIREGYRAFALPEAALNAALCRVAAANNPEAVSRARERARWAHRTRHAGKAVR